MISNLSLEATEPWATRMSKLPADADAERYAWHSAAAPGRLCDRCSGASLPPPPVTAAARLGRYGQELDKMMLLLRPLAYIWRLTPPCEDWPRVLLR